LWGKIRLSNQQENDMAKTLRKRQAKQHARIKAWAATQERIPRQQVSVKATPEGWKKPGSMTK
jgi:hypothetical protein